MNRKIDLTSYHDTIKKMFAYECKTDKEICTALNNICSPSVVQRYRKNNNITRIYKDYSWLKDKYDKNLTAYQISLLCGCVPAEITKYLRKYNISHNNPKNIYNIKKDYFNQFNNYSCYWAGFINADGCIETYIPYDRKSPNYKLKFTIGEKDSHHIQKFVMDLNYPIETIKKGKSSIRGINHNNVKFSTSVKQICLNLTTNFKILTAGEKSCNEIFPVLPNEYYKDYIRGYFDGDGCVCYANKQKSSIVITIVGGYDFCSGLKDFFTNIYGESFGHIYKERPTDLGECENLYRFCFSAHKQTEFFYNYIYYEGCTHLERKKQIFDSFYNKI